MTTSPWSAKDCRRPALTPHANTPPTRVIGRSSLVVGLWLIEAAALGRWTTHAERAALVVHAVGRGQRNIGAMMMHMPNRTGDLVPGPWPDPNTGGASVDDSVGWISPELVEDDGSPPTPSRFLTHPEAAEILRVRTGTVASMVHRGELTPAEPHKAAQLDRDEVERVAARRAVHRPNPYFATGKEAAAILGVNRQRVDQLAADGRLPYVETGVARPRRLYRRAQIEVVASGRSGTRARATNAIAKRPNE